MAAALTDHQVATIRQAIAAGSSKVEALAAADATLAAFDRASLPGGPLHGLRIGRRWRPPSADPTPAEIRLRAAEVRRRWTLERWIGDELVEAGRAGSA